MADLPFIGEPGARASYSQAGFNLLGRVLENVTGLTYERAVASLLIEPPGLPNSSFGAGEAHLGQQPRRGPRDLRLGRPRLGALPPR